MQYPSEFIDSKIIRYRYNIGFINLIISVILMMIVWGFNQTNNFGLMMAYSIWGLYVYLSLLISELRYRGLNILLLYLIGTITRLAYPAFEMSMDGLAGARFSFLHDYTEYVFPTAIAMNIWHMIFIIAMTFFSKNKVLAFDITSLLKKKNILTFIVVIYIIGIVVRIFPQLIFFSDTIRLFIGYFPQLTLLLIAVYCAYNDDKKAFTLMIVILIIEEYNAIFYGFTKHAIVFNLLFIILYFFLRQRNKGKKVITPKFILVLSLVISFVILFVFPFMNAKRILSSWDPLTNKTYSNYSNIDIIQDVITGEAMKFYRQTNRGNSATEGLLNRSNFIPYNAYFYRSSDKEGRNQILLKGTMTYLLPRILRGGKAHDVKLNYHLLTTAYINTGTWNIYSLPYSSGTPTGSFGGAYLWGGWIAVILVCILNAFVITKVLMYSISYQKNLLSIVLIMMILISFLSSFEETHDGGVARNVTYLVYAFLVYISSMIFNIKREKSIIFGNRENMLNYDNIK